MHQNSIVVNIHQTTIWSRSRLHSLNEPAIDLSLVEVVLGMHIMVLVDPMQQLRSSTSISNLGSLLGATWQWPDGTFRVCMVQWLSHGWLGIAIFLWLPSVWFGGWEGWGQPDFGYIPWINWLSSRQPKCPSLSSLLFSLSLSARTRSAHGGLLAGGHPLADGGSTAAPLSSRTSRCSLPSQSLSFFFFFWLYDAFRAVLNS